MTNLESDLALISASMNSPNKAVELENEALQRVREALNQGWISVDMVAAARGVVNIMLHPTVEADEVFLKPITDLIEALEEKT